MAKQLINVLLLIDVVVRHLQDLTYDAGAYEFVFPMVVGPRFMPGSPLAGPPAGDGTKTDTTRVTCASNGAVG